MAKDRRISELPGIAPAAVVGLTRDGIVTVADLVAADFDRVAYLVDDYNEAARLVREAVKEVPGATAPPSARRSRSTHHDGPGVATPVVRSPINKAHAIPHKPAPAAAAPVPVPPPASRTRADMRETSASNGLTAAMDLALRGLRLGSGESGDQSRATLRRRLDAASALLEHGADEQEICAALLLEPAESGEIESADLGKRFGAGAAQLVEECTSLRAIPMLPTGQLPRSYLDSARDASTSARRVCAAYLLATDRRGGAAWHARLLSEALAAGEPDDLVTLARSTVERAGERAAA
jgi:hypothetical protein